MRGPRRRCRCLRLPRRIPAPPEDLSAEAQYESAPAQPVSPDLTGMDLIKRELGGRVIAEIDEP